MVSTLPVSSTMSQVSTPSAESVRTTDRTSMIVPGSTVIVRDEQWLVTSTAQTEDGLRVDVQGLSELVRDTTASFYAALDEITPFNPRDARLRADDSPKYRQSRVWLEAMMRQIPVPLEQDTLTVSSEMLLDPLEYQYEAVERALSPENLRPRILLADAVGLGKTAEIGMILSELVRRGRGDRILIVTPKHVLEQTQQEMWVRFALPFVRLDSVGIQRVRQELPASRNPFAYYHRVIVSIDTLKSDRYLSALQRQQWDAVVIDEAHGLSNSATQNNRLARTLSRRTDALILASATPHNGDPHSFAELVRLLDPSAVPADGIIDAKDSRQLADLRRLVVRRHRNTPSVAKVVGTEWAPRAAPVNLTVETSPEEEAVARELQDIWLFPESGRTPYSGQNGSLFGWVLAKAYLSSPAALAETITQRRNRLVRNDAPRPASSTSRVDASALLRCEAPAELEAPFAGPQTEIRALDELARLNDAALSGASGKLLQLTEYLKEIGIGPRSKTRVVVFAERVATLKWLKQQLPALMNMPDKAFEVMHGGLTDEEQQSIVDRFKRSQTDLRVLITGDVASEGVNLHAQCHDLVHFDIPWSLIRIEQRNGRIDRYGQKHSPRIATLLLTPRCDRFSGDLRVLTTVVEKEHQAHEALGDTASLLGKHSVKGEEEAIRDALMKERDLRFSAAGQALEAAEKGDLSAAQAATADVTDSWEALLLSQLEAPETAMSNNTNQAQTDGGTGLFRSPSEYLNTALQAGYANPEERPGDRGQGGGVGLQLPEEDVVELVPPPELRQRLSVLPQSYIKDRKINDGLLLVTSKKLGEDLYARARNSDSLWPTGHYLGPLHPVLDWAGDRLLSRFDRNEIPVMRSDVEMPVVAVVGTLSNVRGQVISRVLATVHFTDPGAEQPLFTTMHESFNELVETLSIASTTNLINPGPVPDEDLRALQHLIPASVDAVLQQMEPLADGMRERARQRVQMWRNRTGDWAVRAGEIVQRGSLLEHRDLVDDEKRLAEMMKPQQNAMVRPLILVVPKEGN